jgi:hypothetical protein
MKNLLMKKNYFLILMCTAISAQAQLILTQAGHEYSVGDVVNWSQYDSTTTVPRMIGQNQVWDFSTAVSQSLSGQVHYSDCSNSDCLSHATMNSSESISVVKNYESSTTPVSKLEYIGFFYRDESATSYYDDPEILAVWPISYGSTNTDSFSAYQSDFNGNGILNGVTSYTAAGTGTLIIPGGIQFSNVLQVKNIETSTLTYTSGSMSPVASTVTTYSYYHNSQKAPLLEFFESYDTFSHTFNAYIRVNSFSPTAIRANNVDNFFSISPNPAGSSFTIHASNAGNEACILQLYNSTGGLVKTVNAGNASVINTHIEVLDLSAGIYFIRTQLGETSAVKKVVIE